MPDIVSFPLGFTIVYLAIYGACAYVAGQIDAHRISKRTARRKARERRSALAKEIAEAKDKHRPVKPLYAEMADLTTFELRGRR